MENLSDIIQSSIVFNITESKDKPNKSVLAEVEGDFFVPDGMSRNERWYPKELWETVLKKPKIKQKIEDKLMFGTIGHDAILGDEGLRKGDASHIITELRIDGNKGRGKALILDTPVGRILNTIVRAGSKLAVSSRANGTFEGKYKGKPVVCKETYDLEGFDFVIDPGFLEARPELQESLQEIKNKINIEEDSEGEIQMEKTELSELCKSLTSDKADLMMQVEKLTDANKALEEANKALSEENESFADEVKKLEEANEVISNWEKLGTLEQVTEALEIGEKTIEELKEWKEFADSSEDCGKALKLAESLIDTLTEAFGAATVSTVKEKAKLVEGYSELGEVEQVKAVLEAFEQHLDEEAKTKKAAQVESLSKVINRSVEETAKLLEKYEEEDILALYKEVNEDDDSKTYKKNGEVNEDENSSDLEDDQEEVSEADMTLAAKIGNNLWG